MASPEFSGRSHDEDRLRELRELAVDGYPLASNVIVFDYTHFGYSPRHFHELNARNQRRLPLSEVVGRLVTAPRWPASDMEHAAGVSLAILDETENGFEYPVPGIIKVSQPFNPHGPEAYTLDAGGSLYTKPDFLHEEPRELEYDEQQELMDIIRRSLKRTQLY